MCTLRGKKHLPGQLESIRQQSHTQWQLWASDDGSQDNTRDILHTYQTQWPAGRLRIVNGPQRGFAANFLSLACRPAIQADYFAYCDQDDIWEANKLERAVAWLEKMGRDVPALYCSRTRLVDEDNQHLVLSKQFTRPTSFSHALVQSIGGGNTMVFNQAARALLQKAGDGVNAVSHDWWTYMVVSGCGGQVFCDAYPSVRYRQHTGNLLGSNMSWSARAMRVRMLGQGIFKSWNDSNLQALESIRTELTPHSQEVLDRFSTARHQWLGARLLNLYRAGIHRQTLLGNLGLLAAAVFKKL